MNKENDKEDDLVYEAAKYDIDRGAQPFIGDKTWFDFVNEGYCRKDLALFWERCKQHKDLNDIYQDPDWDDHTVFEFNDRSKLSMNIEQGSLWFT